MITSIYRFPFSNYLREGIDQGFDLLGLNRFGGLPGPGAPFETQVALLATGLLELHDVNAFLVFSVWGPLHVGILLFDISLSLCFWNDDFVVVRIFLI